MKETFYRVGKTGGKMKTVSIITLGCKVNQVESEQIAEKLEVYGYSVSMGLNSSDIYIINELQIKLRKEKLSEIENNSLIEIRNRNTGNNMILCGVEILLKSNAYSYYYSQLTKEEQNNFSKFPIFTLTKDIS